MYVDYHINLIDEFLSDSKKILHILNPDNIKINLMYHMFSFNKKVFGQILAVLLFFLSS